MANLSETSNYPPGIYRIETTDPLMGGEDGILNLAAKQLASRTAYLKQFADEVLNARGGNASLGAFLAALANSIAATSPEMQDAQVAAINYALNQAAMANYNIRALREMFQQEGEVTIRNRGVVSGCACSKSPGATRNLDIAGGICFANGRTYSVAAKVNSASVPSNTGTGSVVVSAYLQYSAVAGSYVLATTTVGSAVPADGIEIYRLTIPANSTDATDPQLNSVTLTDVRRIEAQFPTALSSPVNVYLPIVPLTASNFRVDVDVVSAVGRCDRDMIVPNSRANNGFSLRLEAAADNVQVRYRVSRLAP